MAAGVAIIAILAFVYATTQASEAARQREAAIAQQKVAIEQKGIADRNAAEAGKQKNIAEENAAEAQRQKAEAERQADAANQEKQRAELNAAEAERQRGVAEAEKKRADEKAREAESEARRAKAGELAAVAQTYAQDYPQRSLLLAVESLTTTLRYDEDVYSGGVQALRDLLAATGGIVLSRASSPGSRVIESGKGNWLVVSQEEGGVNLWPLRGTTIPTDLHQVDGIPQAASGDGRWLITQVVTGTSSGHGSRLWDMELLNAPSKGQHIDGSSPSFSLDNRWLATKSLDRPGSTALYSLTNPGAPPGYLDGDPMEFSSDGRWLATAIAGDSTVLWRLTEDATQPARFVVQGNSAGFSPDAQWLATQDANSTTRVWDVRSSLPVTRVVLTDTLPAPASGELGLTAETSSPTSHARISPSKPSPFSPDGRWLLTSSEQDTSKAVRLWDLTDDKQPPRTWDLSGVPLAFSPDGRWLAARWPTEGTRALTERTSLWELTPDGPEETAIGEEAVGFDASSHWFVTASEWLASATLWNLESPDPRAQPITFRGPDDSGSSFLMLSPDQTSLVMAGRWKPTTLVWKLTRDLASRPSPLELHGSEGGISQVVFSGDGQWIGLQGGNFSADKSIRLWNLGYPRQSGEPVAFDGDLGQWLGVASSPDNRWVLTWDSYDPANLWDLELRPIQTVPLSVEPKVVNAAFSAQSEWLITEHDDGSIYLWRLGASPLSPMPLTDFSPEGVQAATGEGDWFVAQPSDGSTSRLAVLDRRRASRPAASEYQELAARCFDDPEGYLVSPDRRWLVLSRSSRDPDIYLCRIDAETTQPIILKGHEDGILTLSISPDGHWLASGARDTTARLWDLTVDDPNTQVTVVRGHSNVVSTVAFSPDSRLMMSIASNGYSASVQLMRTRLEELLDLACQVAGRNLSQDEWHRFVTAEPYRKTCEQWPAGD